MTLASNIQSQDYQFRYQTLQGFWAWTTRMDVSQAAPVYQIRNITSPFGLLRDSVPIPGDVVQAMATSITELSQAFAPTILLSPTTLTFTLDEGRGFGDAQTVTVTNSGIYGSLLDVSLTSSAAYLTVAPASVGNLAANEAGSFDVQATSVDLVAANSPYAATILLQDVTATNSPQTLPVVVVVRPKAIIQLSTIALNFIVVKPISGAFPPIPVQTFTITNGGPTGSVLEFLVQKLCGASDWLVSFAPTTGTLAALGTQAVSVLVQPPANTLIGTYQETLRVSGYSENMYADVVVTLTVS